MTLSGLEFTISCKAECRVPDNAINIHSYPSDRIWREVRTRHFPLVRSSMFKGESLAWMKEEMGRRGSWGRDASRSSLIWSSPTGASVTQVTCHTEYWRILTDDGLVSYTPRTSPYFRTTEPNSRLPHPIHTGIRKGKLYGPYIIGPGAGDDLIVFPLPTSPHQEECSTPGPLTSIQLKELPTSPHTILPYIRDLFSISLALETGHCYRQMGVTDDLLTIRGWNDLSVWNLSLRSCIFSGPGWSYCAPRPLCTKEYRNTMVPKQNAQQLALINAQHHSFQLLRLSPSTRMDMEEGEELETEEWETVWTFTSHKPIEAAVWMRGGDRLVLYGRHPNTWALVFQVPWSWPGKVREVCRFDLEPSYLPLRLCPEEEIFLSTPLQHFAEKVSFHSLSTGSLLTERSFDRGTFSLHSTSQGTFLALRHHRLDVHTFRGGKWGERLYRFNQTIGAPGGICSAGDAQGFCIWRANDTKALMVDLASM
ncbi:hypothetical protein BJ684DRAFT_17233 [Piptocephalis cylindrospora]|uniref:Uncharacterized protein n=1 Tax=Piptocephalis cylindrospora TaxID=1907219 RepID=A0A4P9Y0R7_9FUNG|nr:hypothetical protein BJ684DRAFT_17233 [Piptocephalis cylindrospora]|eukprot:RKP12264.1 hypothetical protein BJ684DRAFT_17233 [Piptocephalis cylindrospora]